MEELYSIMYEFLGVEMEIRALETVISAIAEGYKEKGQQEILDILCVFEKYIERLKQEMRNSIGLLDEFIAEKKRK